MDSITQAALGATVAAIAAPRGYRRKAMVLGAALGTLPDLDVLIDYGDAVSNFTKHRGFSHSLFVLAPLSLLLWFALRAWWAPVRDAPLRWLAAISLALLTHPLLDAHTAYGTQLFWPLDVPPTMWSTIFIIDPLYTLPLVVAVVIVATRPRSRSGSTALTTGLLLSTLYLGWTWVAKVQVDRLAANSLTASRVQDAELFSTPTPFNSVLWRIVAITDDGYYEGFYSLIADDGPPALRFHPVDDEARRSAADLPAAQRLRWFAQDFVGVQVADDRLILNDLRMGQEPYYVFAHAVAVRDARRWQEIVPERLPFTVEQRAIAATWRRIWRNQ